MVASRNMNMVCFVDKMIRVNIARLKCDICNEKGRGMLESIHSPGKMVCQI